MTHLKISSARSKPFADQRARTRGCRPRALKGDPCPSVYCRPFARFFFAAVLPCPVAQEKAAGPIKIGVIADMSGIIRAIPARARRLPVQLAVEDVGGKVLGRPIEILSADHQTKPDIAGGIARRWYDQEGVHAIVDVVSSGTSLAVARGRQRPETRIPAPATPLVRRSTWTSAIRTRCNGAVIPMHQQRR